MLLDRSVMVSTCCRVGIAGRESRWLLRPALLSTEPHHHLLPSWRRLALVFTVHLVWCSLWSHQTRCTVKVGDNKSHLSIWPGMARHTSPHTPAYSRCKEFTQALSLALPGRPWSERRVSSF